jgi:YidC/Oxa1 family membrane protein insertase
VIEFFRIILYYPFLNLLTFFIWLVPGHNAAWGIIMLTLVVRFALILPSKRAAQAQRKLAQLQPLLEELKTEYGDDRQGMANAQMELYKKNNINPFSSCGLTFIQLPILFILYQAILHGLVPDNPGLYSWLPRPDSINNFFLGIDLLGTATWLPSGDVGRWILQWILPILAAGLQFVQMMMVLPPKPADDQKVEPAMAMQRQMMYIFPFMTLIIARGFPAGVALYWVITTLFSVAQQYFVNKEKLRLTGVDKALKTAEKLHPEAVDPVRREHAKEIVEESTKKGVAVTVRRKSSK